METPINSTTMQAFDPAIRSRVKSLEIERYIHTPQNVELWCLLEDLMFQVSRSNPKPKVMGCLLTGEPHSGKTTAVRQFKQAYLENVPEALPSDVFYFPIPSRARLKGVMFQMAKKLKIPDIGKIPQRNFPTYILVERVATKLWKNYVKLVIIDEFQNLFELPGESRVEILSGFNDMVNESHIPIVLVGVAGVDRILQIDQYYNDESNLMGTFSSRFPEFKLEPWTNDDDYQQFRAFLKTIYLQCDLSPRPGEVPFFADNTIRDWLIEKTGGLTGKLISVIKEATRQVIRKHLPEVLTAKVLERAFELVQAKGW
jgi:hypothetical protein